ncbi:hypothetical protein [Streptomyces sp. Ac-502]|uniref:hypothetical protein n=1 Tax=Streptomyces sp. Ac-502 TaxID=3342801 RepID=UPI003862C11F
MAVAVGERRRHGCLHDHPLAGGVEPVEGDGDVTREQTGKVVGEKCTIAFLPTMWWAVLSATAVALSGGESRSMSSVRTAATRSGSPLAIAWKPFWMMLLV